MKFISLSLAFSAFILSVNGSDVYLHTEKGCLLGKRANVNYNDYSPAFPINLPGCWKDEVESNVDSGARRQSIWVAPPKKAKWGDGLYHCLHKYPTNKTANVCESDKIVTATLRQDANFPFCTDIDDTDKDKPDGYGSFKITQGACDHPTITGHYGFRAPGREAYSEWVTE